MDTRQASTIRPWIFLSLFSTCILALGFVFGQRQGLLLGFSMALSFNLFVYFYGEFRLRRLLGGHAILGQDPWKLEPLVLRLAKSAHIPKPQVIVISTRVPTILSTGRTRSSATIYLSEPLIKTLSTDELEAVIAYEMSRIRRLDTLVSSMSSALSEALLFVPRMIDSVIRILPGFKKWCLFQKLFAPIASLPIKISVQKSTYLKNDAMAAKLTGQPHAMAQALWKIHSYSRALPENFPATANSVFIVSPRSKNGLEKSFSRHPSIEKRIENLVGYYPI